MDKEFGFDVEKKPNLSDRKSLNFSFQFTSLLLGSLVNLNGKKSRIFDEVISMLLNGEKRIGYG